VSNEREETMITNIKHRVDHGIHVPDIAVIEHGYSRVYSRIKEKCGHCVLLFDAVYRPWLKTEFIKNPT